MQIRYRIPIYGSAHCPVSRLLLQYILLLATDTKKYLGVAMYSSMIYTDSTVRTPGQSGVCICNTYYTRVSFLPPDPLFMHTVLRTPEYFWMTVNHNKSTVRQ